jgi:hypothetical protein
MRKGDDAFMQLPLWQLHECIIPFSPIMNYLRTHVLPFQEVGGCQCQQDDHERQGEPHQ